MLEMFTNRSADSLKTRIAESRNRLYRVALAWCGDSMLADDLVQETLFIGINKCHQLREEQRLYAWLYGILSNSWKSHMRERRPLDELNDSLPADAADPCANCEEFELITRVRSAVATLPLIERQVIALVDLGELSYCETALALGIPIGTVMSRLHRARNHLLERMKSHATVATTRIGRIHLIE